MDCDDVMLLLAGEQRTLTGVESSRLRVHLDDCDACRELAADRDDTEWRWLSRIPASDIDAALFDAVIVDPVVFGATTEIAEGGMGRVMRAFDRRLGREVAIKELLDPALRGRFDREARITARLQHPAVVPVYEAGTFGDGRSFYTMPLVPGKTLHDAIVEAGSLAQRLRLMPKVRAVADAIAYAHSRGVIHRDLKPSNVLVGEFGETIVIDWGLAKDRSGEPDDAYLTRRGGAPHLTLVGSVVGTPCYMSPAQASGEPADATDDVYALGAILYTVLTGVPPYLEGRDAVAVIAATIDGPPRPIVELAPDAPADLRAIVERAMARTVTDRFSSAKQFSDELARFEAGQLLLSRGYSTRELISRWVRRHRRALIIAALSMVAVVALGIVWSRYRSTAAALATQVRGGELAALYRDASRQAYQIDRDLLRMETALAGLATAAGDALVGPEPSGTPALYFVEDFASPSRRPPDFGRKTAYRWPVSVSDPVVELSPGTSLDAVLPALHRLAPLRTVMRDLVLESALPDPSKLTREAADAKLLARAAPIDYAYVDLRQGVHVVWPGMANLPNGYDV
ncbi:MAG TPA: serine/threonine-protein kinase, partial [Kofleriaceae bacterium]